MDKTSNIEDKLDERYKRKPDHPFMVPTSFLTSFTESTRHQLQTPQSLNGDSLELGSNWYKEESALTVHEIEDWNDPIANELEELLLSNLQALFDNAIRQIVDLGYNQDVVELAISRKALYTEERNPLSTIVNDTLDVLMGKDLSSVDISFENFQDLLHYTMVELITVLREVKPSLTVADAMWVLLICEFNISLACASESNLSDIKYCDSIPFDETSSKYVPRNEKEEQILKLISRVQGLQDEIQSWDNWLKHKVAQVTEKLRKLQAEFKTLGKKEQHMKTLKENALKMISYLENVVENTEKQFHNSSSTVSLLKKELDAANLLAVQSMETYHETLEREKMVHKQVRECESDKDLLRDECEREKHKLSSLQQELEKEKDLLAKVEATHEKERAASEKFLAQIAFMGKEREQIEARFKSEEDMVRKKAASDLQIYMEDLAILEKELNELKLKSYSKKIAMSENQKSDLS